MKLFALPAKLTGFLLCLFSALLLHTASQAQSRKAMDFIGSTSFEHVNLGDSLSGSLDTASFTLEMWINFDNVSNGDPAFIGNKDWNNGNNTGFAWALINSTTLRFNFRAATGTRRDYNTTIPNLLNNWNHIAVTVNRKDSIRVYVNGVFTGTPQAIKADSAKTLDAALPIRLGTDGTGTYNYNSVSRFNGKIDEVRFWKALRTPAEIRETMCRKIAGTETGLLAYYRMDDTSTSTLLNYATATAGIYDGTLLNTPVRVLSGAPVGDTSIALYPTTFTGQSVQIPTATRGVFTIDSFAGTGTFLQVYRMDSIPNVTAGLTPYKNNNVVFGTFTTNSSLQYFPKFSYNSYDTAKAYKQALQFFARRYNDSATWASKPNLYNDTAAKMLRTDSNSGPRVFFLANFIGSCNPPSALGAGNITYSSAQLSWTTGGSGSWTLQYGPSGFIPGSGTTVTAINTNPYTLTGLQPATAYQFYVRDTCTGIGTSAWVGPFTFTTLALPTYQNVGAGTAININATGWIDATRNNGAKASATALGLPVQNITIESWVKVRQFGQWRSIVGFLQDNGTYERGWNIETGDNNKFRFALSTVNDTTLRYMESASAYKTNQWYHVAGVYDGDTMRIYVNGILEAKNGAPQGAIAYDSSWLAIGAYKDDNEFYPVRGQVDEVRIWNVARSQEELRKTMCQKLQGTETGLVRYFRLDQYAGDTASELTAGLSGKLINLADTAWVVSGAAIGDTSIYTYAANMASASLTLAGSQGILSADSFATNAKGAHVYRIGQAPAYQSGIANLGSTQSYFGVFLAEDEPLAYRVKYDYAGYPAAVAAATNLRLYNRVDNAAQPWIQSPVTNTPASNFLQGKGSWGTRQWLLANFTATTCAGAQALTVSNISSSSATISFTSTAPVHRIQYGTPGFPFGTGTIVSGITTNSYTLTGLALGAAYEVYVMDSCANGGMVWTGPLVFQTVNPCQTPVAIVADSITSTSMVVKWTDPAAAPAFDVSYGPAGFGNPTFGIQSNVTDRRLLVTSLQPYTAYDFYVRSDCGSFNSAWAGPFTFRTDSLNTDTPTSVAVVAAATGIAIYPNPASTVVTVVFAKPAPGSSYSLRLFNTTGTVVYHEETTGTHASVIPVATLPAGAYHLSVEGPAGRTTKTLIIQY